MLERKYAMITKAKAKSRIFEALHDTASDLHRLGFIDKRKMRKFDALCGVVRNRVTLFRVANG